jgi:hypothetical protein
MLSPKVSAAFILALASCSPAPTQTITVPPAQPPPHNTVVGQKSTVISPTSVSFDKYDPTKTFEIFGRNKSNRELFRVKNTCGPKEIDIKFLAFNPKGSLYSATNDGDNPNYDCVIQVTNPQSKRAYLVIGVSY